MDNTKLTSCPACTGTVSKNAETCPHCGEPLKNNVAKEEHVATTEFHSYEVEDYPSIEEKLSPVKNDTFADRYSSLDKEGKERATKGFIIIFVILLVGGWWLWSSISKSLNSDSSKPITNQNITIKKKPSPQVNIAPKDRMVICPAMISAIFFHPIEIINIDNIENEIMRLSYIRKTDNTEWKYLCKISGNQVIWAAPGGRWRDGPYDAVITYQLTEDKVIIKQKFSDNSSSTNAYNRL